jgi:transposase
MTFGWPVLSISLHAVRAQGPAARPAGAAVRGLEATATKGDLAAEALGARPVAAPARERRRAVRKPFPAHLPRERIVVAAPVCCEACGSGRIVKLGEDVTETLEVIPRRWKVVQTVREKFTCQDCERISQPPAPFHPTPRGWAGPNLLATILFEKFGQHQPLNRQAERYAREGVDLSLSTLADQVGACAAALAPLHDRIAAHVLAAERLHGDDTPVPVLAKGKTDTGRLWVYVPDDRPFCGGALPAAASIPWRISPAGAASSRPTPMPASGRSTRRTGLQPR